MKTYKQKSKNIHKLGLVGIILTVICIICMMFYLLVLWPIEDVMTNEAETQDTPKISDEANTTNSADTSKNGPKSTTDSPAKEPTKTPGKTPAQYENETVNDEPAYNNEQFRIPEEE